MIGINSALLNLPLPFSTSSLTKSCPSFPSWNHFPSAADPLLPRSFRPFVKSAATTMESAAQKTTSESDLPMKLLFVEMGVGYDQHGQDITVAAMRACRDAISSNSIPAFRRGSIPGVSFEQMKLQIKLGVPHSLQQALDIEKVKSVFPY